MLRSRYSVLTVPALLLLLAVPRLGAQVEMSASAPAPVAMLGGQIVDSITGGPIAGVLVRVDSGQEVFTDSDGRFHFAGLPQGKRLIALLTEDCRITWGEVTVVERFPRNVEFRLPPAFGAKRRRTLGRSKTGCEPRAVEWKERKSTGVTLEA